MITDTNTLAALEQLLSDLHDRAQSEHPAIADTMREALAICRSRHAPLAGTNLQLQGALASLRSGRPDDAAEFIERAIDIQSRWAGDVTR